MSTLPPKSRLFTSHFFHSYASFLIATKSSHSHPHSLYRHPFAPFSSYSKSTTSIRPKHKHRATMSSSNKKSNPGKRGTDSQEDSQPAAKKPMFSIFDKKSNVPATKAPIKWQTYGTSCIVGEAFDPKAHSKVASYDLVSLFFLLVQIPIFHCILLNIWSNRRTISSCSPTRIQP